VTRFLLVRHGQSGWNASGRWQGQADPPLTDLGRLQAVHAAAGIGMVDAINAAGFQAHHFLLALEAGEPRRVARALSAEAIFLSLVGGVIGIVIGIGGAYAITLLSSDFKPIVQASAIALAVGFSFSVGLFFGIYPARRAARLNPIDALRYE